MVCTLILSSRSLRAGSAHRLVLTFLLEHLEVGRSVRSCDHGVVASLLPTVVSPSDPQALADEGVANAKDDQRIA